MQMLTIAISHFLWSHGQLVVAIVCEACNNVAYAWFEVRPACLRSPLPPTWGCLKCARSSIKPWRGRGGVVAGSSRLPALASISGVKVK